jgi:D-cysteine desulfhydrase
MHGLLNKVAFMMRRLDRSVPADLAARTNIIIRDGFFGPGYAQSTPDTDRAIEFAREHLDLTLESTYTGKTMAALLADLEQADELNYLYWHTFNSVPIDVPSDRPLDRGALPEEFMRYFE